MQCMACDGTAVTKRPDLTVQGYRRLRCRACGKPFNERSAGVLNRTQYPSDVIALAVFCARYKLSLRDQGALGCENPPIALSEFSRPPLCTPVLVYAHYVVSS